MRTGRSFILGTTAAALLMAAQAASAETITVWSRETAESIKTLELMASQFTKETGIQVTLYRAMNDFEQRLARSAAGHDLPDLVINDSAELGQLRKMGIVEQVNRADIKGSDKVLPVAWQSAQAPDGNYYGVPISAQTFALFIRKDWREKLGLPLPETWKDVHDMAVAFTKDDPDGDGKADTYGFTMPVSTTRGYASWFISSFLWQAGGNFVTQKGDGFLPALDTKAGADALGYMRAFLCEGLAQPGAINATTSDVNPSFMSGQTGMYFTGPYNIATYDSKLGTDKFEVVAPPAGPGGPAALAEGTTAYFMKGSQHGDAARRFVEYLISPEGQLAGMAVDNGLQPEVRLPVIDDPKVQDARNDPRWKVFSSTYAKESRYVPPVPNWEPVRMTAADGFNAILADCTSDIPAELKKTDAKLADVLSAQGALAKASN